MIKKIEFDVKQIEAIKYLKDDSSEVIMFAGAANTGKSWLASTWLITNALVYKESRGAICRRTLKEIKDTTLKTFVKCANFLGIKKDVDYKINLIESKIYFKNGSEIYLIPLAYQPSDPNADFLGGIELTYAFIDEIPNISKKYYEVLYSRIRYCEHPKKIWYLPKKLFLCCNPASNWVRSEFYDKHINNCLPDKIKFVNAVGNYYSPYRGKGYEQSLSLLSEQQRKRLFEGSWDFDTESDQIFNIDKIESIFSGLDYSNSEKYYISADIAAQGKDTTVIVIWKGFKIIEIKLLKEPDTIETSKIIHSYMQKYKIPKNQVIVDSVGNGKGVKDYLKCVGFIANGKPLKGEKYDMIKSQLFYKLVSVDWSVDLSIDRKYVNKIKEELQAIRDTSDEFKLSINSKDQQKLLIGRSPDFADAISFRMFFEFGESKMWLGVAN